MGGSRFAYISLTTYVQCVPYSKRSAAATTTSVESNETSSPKEEPSKDGEQPPPAYDEKQGEVPGVLPSSVNLNVVDNVPDGDVLSLGDRERKISESV